MTEDRNFVGYVFAYFPKAPRGVDDLKKSVDFMLQWNLIQSHNLAPGVPSIPAYRGWSTNRTTTFVRTDAFRRAVRGVRENASTLLMADICGLLSRTKLTAIESCVDELDRLDIPVMDASTRRLWSSLSEQEKVLLQVRAMQVSKERSQAVKVGLRRSAKTKAKSPAENQRRATLAIAQKATARAEALRPFVEDLERTLTLGKALAKAACNLLQLEAGEILAEYRPALTDAGAEGLEAEIFLYDTLAGGAGFAPQLVSQGDRLFKEALRILSSCPNNCDASCYRCLRSFRNKLDHSLLDRKLGEQFLRHALEGGYPEYEPSRVATSLKLLADDLSRQFGQEFEFELSKTSTLGGRTVLVPLLATRRTTGAHTCVCLTSPIAPEVPVDRQLRGNASGQNPVPVDDLLIRRNLPRATENTFKQLS